MTKQIIKKLNDKTRAAVFLTHRAGLRWSLSMNFVQTLRQRNIPLIEDVCESHGAMRGGKNSAALGWISNFSFYYAHHMTTIEGGMICAG